jgi:hypothetical protein
MKLKIMIGFIAMFAVISYFVPAPLFPGNYIIGGVGQAVQFVQENMQVFSALFNGLFYGGIMGLIFFGLSGKVKL